MTEREEEDSAVTLVHRTFVFQGIDFQGHINTENLIITIRCVLNHKLGLWRQRDKFFLQRRHSVELWHPSYRRIGYA